MSAYLDPIDEAPALRDVMRSLAGIAGFQAYRFLDDVAGEHKRYETFKIVCPDRTLVLKQYDSETRYAAEKAICDLFPADLPVPRMLAASDNRILTEFIPGADLMTATDAGIAAAGKSIAEIMNAFPFDRAYDRTFADEEIAYREKRLPCLRNEPLLSAAYEAFLARAKEMPLTLANGDLVPINCLCSGERAYLIDWEYGGFLPYALDLGRFLAHSGEEETAVYRMTEAQKRLFVDTIYDSLVKKPDRAVFDRDVQFAVFDECIMILSFYVRNPDEKRDADYDAYRQKCFMLARALLG